MFLNDEILHFLQDNNFKVLNVEDCGTITIRYRGMYISICNTAEDPHFVGVVMPSVDKVTDNMDVVLRICNDLALNMKVVKAIVEGEGNVMLVYEFFYETQKEVNRQLTRALRSLDDSLRQYRLRKSGEQE